MQSPAPVVELRFKISTAEPPKSRQRATTKRRRAEEWEDHKDYIRSCYVDEKQTPEEVLEGLKRRKFEVSQPQLMHKLQDWDFKQKAVLTRQERCFVAKQVSDRKRAGKKDSAVKRKGIELNSKNVMRTVRRRMKEDRAYMESDELVACDTSCAFTVFTPENHADSPANTPPRVIDLSGIITDSDEEDMDILAALDDPHDSEYATTRCRPYYADNIDNTVALIKDELSLMMNSIDQELNAMMAAIDLTSPDEGSSATIPSSRSLTTQQKKQLLDDISLFYINFEMSSVYRDQGRFADAMKKGEEALLAKENILLQVLPWKEASLGKTHPTVLRIIERIGLTLLHLGRCGEALPWFKRAYYGLHTTLGEHHLSTLTTLHWIGAVINAQERHQDALWWYKAAHRARRTVLGEYHEYTLNVAVDIGQAYYKLGQYERAFRWINHAWSGRKKVFGEFHSVSIRNALEVAQVLNRLGRHKEALKMVVSSLEDRRRVSGEEHPDTLDHVYEVALILFERQRYSKVEYLLENVLPVRRRILGEDDEGTRKVEALLGEAKKAL